ncbi:hypothetical protein KO481_16720 [Nocardia sp. NEAU-G5]|uniref:Integrase n=1 Tax=Nocardia albiluteola TaxID=2842303 RepID=A0ABS6B0A5_9NOCA|nr:hypothetical protein [Nocardia albiluteola]MBU3063166.1 hypothetical protein [Nocardia albiluteola]
MTASAVQHWELPGEEDLVLVGRPLRPGMPLEQTSRFGDERWRLEPAVLQQHVSSVSLNFALVPPRYRLHAKQLCYAMLAGPLPAGEQRLNPLGIPAVLTNLRRFLHWLDTRPTTPARPQPPPLAEVIEDDLTDYFRHLVLVLPHAGTRSEAQRSIHLLWRYRRGLPDPLRIDPRQVDGWRGQYGRGPENSTARIPEPVLGPLISWAIRFVDHFAADILAAERQRRVFDNRSTSSTAARHIVRQQLRAYLDDHIAHGRPLPGHQGKPNQQFIAFQVGGGKDLFHHSTGNRKMLFDTAEKVGVTEHTWIPSPITGTLDGRAWLEGISSNHSHYSVTKLSRMLQVAAYITIAFLSGMRDSEVKHLQRGSITVERDADGRPYRWKLTSRAFKGTRDPAGTTATWIVGHPAVRAAAVLEKLHPPTRSMLFANLPRVGTTRAVDPHRAQATKSTNEQLAEFVDWIEHYCTDHHRTDTVPAVNGRPWPLSTGQFRRTLAWFIARRPGGSIAGAIAFRHLSIQMFEGYAGTSDSGFRGEVEAEQALTRGEHLIALIDAHEHTRLAGPAADEAHRRLQEFGEQAGFPGAVVTDNRRLQRLLHRADPAVYPGTFATCVFDPDKALCQQDRDQRGTRRPGLGTCRPIECANTALTVDNLAALRAELDQVTLHLAQRPGLPPLLSHRLRSRRTQIAQFLDRHALENP